MEKVGCITFNNLYKEVVLSTTKSFIKAFILKEDVKNAIENNDFDYVFESWSDYAENYLPRSLIKLFLEAGIDFLPYMSKIPNEFFKNCDFIRCVEIPASIKSIGGYSFQYTNLKEFKVKKRNSELYIYSRAFYNINDTWNQGNKTAYIFEDTKEKLSNLFTYNTDSDNYITFTCSDGDALL